MYWLIVGGTARRVPSVLNIGANLCVRPNILSGQTRRSAPTLYLTLPYLKAEMPVISSPRMRVWMSNVPS
jgi:hypothetical protein